VSVRACSIVAPAKVNLFLRVLHRRPDGFREIETLFQTISLADQVDVAIRPGPRRVLLDVAGAGDVPPPDLGPMEANLAWRAAMDFMERANVSASVHIRLAKHIPAGAGLGGGSSDAAAVLRGLQALTDSDVDLSSIGAGLGSDVPFFCCGSPTAIGRGRGELLTPLPPLPRVPLVVALPPVHMATARAYAALADSRGPDEVDPHGGGRLLRSTASSWEALRAMAENDFEALVRAEWEPVAASLDGLRGEGAVWALLSGSGAASFGVFPTEDRARLAAKRLTDSLGWPFVRAWTCHEVPLPRSRGSSEG
jgi:4-diphosphocytidyl-2-C-methyl-D-erythritol kinase